MAKLNFQYSWASKLNMNKGGYPGEDIWPEESSVTWHTTDEDEGESRETFHFTDSNYSYNSMGATFLNNNGSRVYVTIADKWKVRRGTNNVIYVDVTTTVERMWRGGITGNPTGGGNYGRDMRLTMGNEVVFQRDAAPIGVEEVYISSPVTRSYTLTINPEEDANGKNSVNIWSHTSGFPETGTNTDDFGIGVAFKNLLPREFSHRLNYHLDGAIDGPENEEWTSRNQCESHQVSTKTPKKPHWVFLGYSTDPNAKEGTVWPGNNITVCEQVDLYAKWRYTYRPGMVMHGGVWKSCDRDGKTGPVGFCNIRKDGAWQEMRIDPVNYGLDDPPCIYDNNNWRVMKLIGDEGREHVTEYDCPHQWK